MFALRHRSRRPHAHAPHAAGPALAAAAKSVLESLESRVMLTAVYSGNFNGYYGPPAPWGNPPPGPDSIVKVAADGTQTPLAGNDRFAPIHKDEKLKITFTVAPKHNEVEFIVNGSYSGSGNGGQSTIVFSSELGTDTKSYTPGNPYYGNHGETRAAYTHTSVTMTVTPNITENESWSLGQAFCTAYRTEYSLSIDGPVAEGAAATATLHRFGDLGLATTTFEIGAVAPEQAVLFEDYTVDPLAGEFAPGETDKILTIPTIDDDLTEPDEQYQLRATDPYEMVLTDNAAAASLILANDVPDVWVEATQPVAAESVGGDGPQALFTFHRNHTASPLDVWFDADGGEGTQYVLTPGPPRDDQNRLQLHFAAGDAVAAVTATAVDDQVIEGTQGFALTVLSPGPDENPYNPVAPNPAYGRIRDNDYDVTLEAVDTAAEGNPGAGAGFMLRRVGDPDQPLHVVVNTSGSADAGDDYDVSPFSDVQFLPDEMEKWLPLDPVDDQVIEWTEDVVLTVVSTSDYRVVGSPTATDEIVDNDRVDVVIQGLPEESEPVPHEMDPGGLLALNDDDDDGNGTPDNEQVGVALTDDELEPVVLDVPAGAKQGVQLTLSLEGSMPGGFRVWDKRGRQILGLSRDADGSPNGPVVTSAPLDPADGASQVVYLEAITAYAQAYVVLAANDAPTARRPSSSGDRAKATAGVPAEGDLDIATVEHNLQTGWLDENLEKSQGAFLPVNNDDDDYSAVGSDGGQDFGQTGRVVGENDLLPIVIHPVNAQTVTLTAPKGSINVYGNDDRTNPIQLGQPFAAPQQDMFLYVEATSKGKKELALSVDGQPTKQTILLTAFEWRGPLNVPQYGTYKYAVADPPTDGKWLTPENGNVAAGADTSNVDISWGAGPQVGKAVYQAHADYLWDLEVDIVEVIVSNPTTGAAFTGGGAAQKPTEVVAGVKIKPVESKGWAGNPGIMWKAQVTFNGPTLNGKADRGLLQMRAGFVQNLTVSQFNASYTGGLTATSALQKSPTGPAGNGTFWDTKNRASYADKFYSIAQGSIFENARPGLKSAPISEDDSPKGGPPTQFRRAGQGGVIQDLTGMNLVWDFDLYVSVVTRDVRGGANGVYVNQAEAKWQFNASGTFNPNANYAWFAALGAGTTTAPPSGWAPVTGPRQPKTDGDRFNAVVNDLQGKAKWL